MTETGQRDQFGRWTNASIVKLFGDADPVQAVIEMARSVAASALDEGWGGPPYDPIGLADLRRITVVPRDDVFDARLVSVVGGGVQIEYNPNRPAGRRRFSVAHELAHTLFPDYRDATRNRAKVDRATSDDWQLEALCNLAAAEFVMPIGSFRELGGESLDLRHLLELRQKFGVSTEAILLRAGHLHREPVAVFAASERKLAAEAGAYRIDYLVGSGGWDPGVHVGATLKESVVSECTAIGYSAHAEAERWPDASRELRVDAVGIPPYPGHLLPRVVGLIRPPGTSTGSRVQLTYLFGDASEPHGDGPRVIAHIVNDRAMHWKGGFAASLRAHWPAAASDFTRWAEGDAGHLQLGSVHFTGLDHNLWAAALVAQAGYGPSRRPRVRYAALRTALRQVATFATQQGAKVQMPRIGAGQAGGAWPILEDLIASELCAREIAVTIYDLPGQMLPPAVDSVRDLFAAKV